MKINPKNELLQAANQALDKEQAEINQAKKIKKPLQQWLISFYQISHCFSC